MTPVAIGDRIDEITAEANEKSIVTLQVEWHGSDLLANLSAQSVGVITLLMMIPVRARFIRITGYALVLRDIRGLSERDAIDVSRWAARAMLRQSLSEVSARRSKTLPSP